MRRCVLALLPIAALPLFSATPELTLSPVTLGPGRHVRFETPQQPEPAVVPPDKLTHMPPYVTTDREYVVYVDLDRIFPVPRTSLTNYFLYVGRRPADGLHGLYEVLVVGAPEGDFSDRWASVQFTIDGKHTGQITLPLHSDTTKDFISVSADPANIDLPADRHKLTIRITNHLDGFKVRLDSITMTATHPHYWTGELSLKGRQAIRLDESGQPGSVTIVDASTLVEPYVSASLVHALWGSLLNVEPETPHDELQVTVRYSADLGGGPHTIQTPLRVRFIAPWYAVLAAALTGSALGTAVAMLFPAVFMTRASWKGFASAALLALVAETLVLATDPRVSVFHIQLDARQLLPAFVLGVLAGLFGTKLLHALRLPASEMPGGVRSVQP